MLPIQYSKRTRSKVYLHPNSMTPIRPSSHFDYTEYKAELDRRRAFGELKRDDSKAADKTENNE